MSMSTTNRFMFDTEFGSEAAVRKKTSKAAEPQEAVYTESDVALLKTQAFEEGMRTGQSQSMTGIESTVADTMAAIGTQLQQLIGTHEAKLQAVKQDAARLAMEVAGKLAPAMIEQAPEEEVLKTIEDCLVDLNDEPRIVVRASDEICGAIAGKIDAIANKAGFQGKLILLPDEMKQGGDCRIEWADGGAERNIEDIRRKMDGVVSRFIHSSTTANDQDIQQSGQQQLDQM